MKFDLKRKSLVYAIILLLILIAIVPSINAVSTQVSINKNDEKLCTYGSVTGMITTYGFMPQEITGAILVLEGGLIKRITFSGFWGFYSFNFVTVGRQYTLTVTHPQYKTESKTFTLSPDDPFKIISFSLKEKDTSKTKTEKPVCLGSIWGNTGEWYIWGFSPVGLVNVEAGGKSTISSPIMGFYKIRNLLLGTYTVTGTKTGYETFTDTVKLTEEHPDQKVFIHMETNDENAKEKTNTKTTEQTINNDDSVENTNIVKSTANMNNNKPACFGTILGKTGTYMWSGWCPINFVKVTIRTRAKYSNPHFFFTGLPLEQTYTVTASKAGWKTESKEVTLTKDNPVENIQFDLDDNSDKNVKTIIQNQKVIQSVLTKSEDPTFLGSIYGNAGTSYGWGFSPVGLVKIQAGGRTTYSSPILGNYRIRNLPLDTYTITGSKLGYDTFTDTVILTKDRPVKQVFIHMEPNDTSVNKAKISYILPFDLYNREISKKPMTLSR